MKAWAASLALHGVAVGAAALLWLERSPETPSAPPLRWQVSFASAPAEAPPPATPPRPAPPPESGSAGLTPPEAVPPSLPTRLAAAPIVAVPAAATVAEPAPAVAAAPSQTATEAAAAAERRWQAALAEKLRLLKRYPLAARRLGQEGVVVLSAAVTADGRLESVAVKQGPGYPLLERDALSLLQAAAAAVRAEMQPERPTRLEIPVAYRLEG
ncbi:outer membrane transport energization protein TonB [Sulfuritortus calidifontis]|uniref:Outer membrane transport energization protein TonB n=1 Tax=Sulfuritortus calidifontis TaxID=1914471 RepID=A0A4R3JXJ6_9PROT|nr:TonB family protein [Sulfuritortus calidifontis]TCS73252.1 outer membrane transport energization protein TonB [Sulfuritortus calidifontis]